MTGFKDHFSETAVGYAAFRPAYPATVAEYLANVASPRGLVWEAGCGSGQLSVLLAERFDRVIATDASVEQIAQARAHPKIEYRVARAEASALPDHSADLAVAAQAAHWFDLDAYYGEVRRVVRPGGFIALICYGIHSTNDAAVDHVVGQFYGVTLRAYWPPERRHIENEYRSLPFPFEEIKSPKLEIRVRWTLAEMAGYIESWSAVWAISRIKGREPIDAFQRDLANKWGPADTTRPVRWPLAMRVGRV